jgi:hypothetical protein
MFDNGIEVAGPRDGALGAGVILADTPGSMDEDLIEPAIFRLVGIFIPEMPLAEDTGAVAGITEHIGDGGHPQGHALALEDGVADAQLKGIPACHEGSAGRSTGGADMEVGKASRLGIEGIQMRGLQPWVAMATEVPVALVIGHDEDDVGSLGCLGRGRIRAGSDYNQEWECEPNRISKHLHLQCP